MNRPYYLLGRFLQVIGLVVMPFAIWVGHFGHNERGAIVIFLSSIAIFFVGRFLSQIP